MRWFTFALVPAMVGLLLTGCRPGVDEAEYKKRLEKAHGNLFMQAFAAKQLCEGTIELWQATISSRRKTIEAELARVRNLPEYVESMKGMEGMFDGWDAEMKELANPPARYVPAYNKLVEAYGTTKQLRQLADNITGYSLFTYSNKVNETYSAFVKASNELKLLRES